MNAVFVVCLPPLNCVILFKCPNDFLQLHFSYGTL